VSRQADTYPEGYYPGVKGFRGETVPALFLERYNQTPDKVAFRTKNLGIYKEITWREYKEHVENLCHGLLSLGLRKGDRIAIMGDPSVELCYSELAPQFAGAIVFGIYPTVPPVQIKYYLQDSGARFIIAQNQQCVDKILEVIKDLPDLERIIVVDPTAMWIYSDRRLITFGEVERLGIESKKEKPALFQESGLKVSPDDIASILYTSGTTGEPRGTFVLQRQFPYGILNWLQMHPLLRDEKATTISFMPLAHMVGRVISVYLHMVGGYVVYFGEGPESMEQTLWEVSPDFIVGPPRTYEKYCSRVLIDIESSSWLKKHVYSWAMVIGRSYLRRKWAGRVPPALAVAYRVAYMVLFRSILDKLGFLHTKLALIGGAPVPPEVVTSLQIWGLNVVELYCSAEGGIITVQQSPFPKPGNAGRPIEGTKIKISDIGEILVRNNSFAGYWNRPEATAEVLENGWVHTGDIGQFVEKDNVRILGQVKDVLITSGGKAISPAEIERTIKASPYVSSSCVFGEGRRYLSCVIEIDFDSVSEWARKEVIPYTSYASLATNPRICDLIGRQIEKVNQQLAGVEQLKKFRIIPRELDPEEVDDPVTPTRKIQRHKFYEQFRDLVDSMYTEEEQELVRKEGGPLLEEIHKRNAHN
jgi:long-chain acyl-CoA synthetase